MKLSLIVDGYISSGDSTTIIDMVELCPWLGGYAIGLDYDIFAEITDSMPGHIVYPCDLMELRSISTFADQIGTYINVFPNPVTNLLTIDSGTEIQEISLYDLSSKLILQTNPNVKKYTLNLSAIHDGLYLLSINLGKSQENFKILINP